MISSLASAFDLAGRRAVFIAADKVTVYHWGRSGLSDSFMFDADDTGLGFFRRYVEESPDVPVYLLIDAIEEEFRSETVPHAIGGDRKSLLERRKSRSFRNTPYIYATVQGREGEGRRDDRVLLAGLTNPDLLAPWLQVFDEVKVPVAGIYSLPLLSSHLLPMLKLQEGQVLLVSMQAASGLRQSAFVDGGLRASRLAKLGRATPDAHADLCVAELERFRRYLTSARLLAAEVPLTVCVLSHGEIMQALSSRLREAENLSYRMFDVARVGRTLKVSGVLTTPYSDTLFAHLLLSRLPPNHYGSSRELRHFRMHRARIALYATAMSILFGGMFYAGYEAIGGLTLAADAANARERTKFYADRLAIARGGLPPTPVEPFDIEVAVNTVEALEAGRVLPTVSMQLLGRHWPRDVAVQLTNFKWFVEAPNKTSPRTAAGTAAARTELRLDGPQKTSAKPWRLMQHLEFSGELSDFSGDYRAAIDTVRSLAERLASDSAVYEVKVLELPIDADPSNTLSGTTTDAAAGTSSERAAFKMYLLSAWE